MTGNSSEDCSGRIGRWNGVSTPSTAPKGRCAANWQVVPTFARDWFACTGDKRFEISCADYNHSDGNSYADSAPLWTWKETIDKVEYVYPGYFAMAADPDAKPAYRKSYNAKMNPGKWDIYKYCTEDNALTNADLSNVNWYILRYSDVLLLYAEALNEWRKGPNDAAFAAVNQVRRRGYGLPQNTSASCDLSNTLGYEEFREAVRQERAWELAFEGHRRQDLVRWGIYYDTIRNTYAGLAEWHEDAQSNYLVGQYTIKGKNELLPIPQHDKDLCPKFRQNPGWE